MNQTRLESFIESLANIFLGYGVAMLSQVIIFPMFGINVPFSTNMWIGAWFTLISLIRSYVVRRFFNAQLHRVSGRVARQLVRER